MNHQKKLDVELLLDKYRKLDCFANIGLIKFDQSGIGEDTPLHMASYSGDFNSLIVMLDTDVDVNVKGDIGNTPLHNAALKKHADIVLALLKAGADPSITNDYGDYPIDYVLGDDASNLKNILRYNP
ncbi:MAG: ankyrin repeat domain-containing protein [Methylococcales bacterium]|nr:ankyrin repeat domain-containing protein [Methylococcales bacterium]